jgi:hypothetical membrane protein
MNTAVPASAHGARSAGGDRPLALRLALACGAVAPLLFIVVVLVAGATRPHYSALHHPVSLLSLADSGWVQVANFIVSGALVVCFAAGLRLVLHPGRAATWGPVLLAVFGLSLVGAGVFSTDPALGYPPGAPAGSTTHGALHLLISNIGFLSLMVASFVLAARFAGEPDWRGWTIPSIVGGCLIVVFAIGQSLVTSPDPAAPTGLFQRLSIFSGLVWLAAFATRLTLRGGM